MASFLKGGQVIYFAYIYISDVPITDIRNLYFPHRQNGNSLQCCTKYKACWRLFSLQQHRKDALHSLSLSLQFQATIPLSVLHYANGGPIIKASDVRNDKPTGRRGAQGVKSPQGSALIWMPATVMAKHSRDGRSPVMRERGK